MAARRTSRAVLLVTALLALAGCGDRGDDGLYGFVRPKPLQVGGAALPDVSAPASAAPMRFRAAKDGMLLVFFGYTSCPDECPATLADLRQAERLLPAAERSRTSVALVTVDPARDTPAVLQRYVRRFATDWHALRPADPAQQRAAERAFRSASRLEAKTAHGTYGVAHTLEVYGVDDRGTVIVEWPYGTSAAAIAADVRKLLGG